MAEMKDTKNKWLEAVSKLIELTQDGVIEWSVGVPSESIKPGPDDRVQIAYTAEHLGRQLCLFRRYYKAIIPDPFSVTIESYWESQTVLQYSRLWYCLLFWY